MMRKFLMALLTASALAALAQPLQFKIEGVSNGVKDTIMQDREEAVMDAKVKALRLLGVSITPFEYMDSFLMRQKWVDEKSKEIILPGYTIIDKGYGADGRFRIELVARIEKQHQDSFEGETLYQGAMEILEYNRDKALEMFRDIFRRHPYSDRADDALYHLILDSDFWSASDQLETMKSLYHDSPFISQAEQYVRNIRLPGPLPGMLFVPLPLGEYQMGSPDTEEGRDSDEGPRRLVRLRPLYMAATEITQGQWVSVMGNNPSKFQGEDHPVERVSWDEVQMFIDRLNQMDPGKKYRLPSEAEWEYACRGGSDFRFAWGNQQPFLDSLGWYQDNSGKTTHQAGVKPPNNFGLHDMHGNVSEWCQDPYFDNFLGAPRDGSVWLKGDEKKRVTKGGSWSDDADECRSSNRGWQYRASKYSNVGFRIVREP